MRLKSVFCGQVVAKYLNSLPVGFSVDRLPNFRQVFLGTPSFNAKVYQLDKASDVPSKANAISSKRPAVGEGASLLGEVIASTTFSVSAQTANCQAK